MHVMRMRLIGVLFLVVTTGQARPPRQPGVEVEKARHAMALEMIEKRRQAFEEAKPWLEAAIAYQNRHAAFDRDRLAFYESRAGDKTIKNRERLMRDRLRCAGEDEQMAGDYQRALTEWPKHLDDQLAK